VSTAEFPCVGRGHQVRFSEDFDELLSSTIQITPDPLNASRELDDVALLTVLANSFALADEDVRDALSAFWKTKPTASSVART